MKYCITGDWHLRATKPARRIDDFYETQKDKVEQVLKLAIREKCDAIIQPGDMFDTPRVPHWLLADYIKMFREYKIPILTVWGQHDMWMQNRETLYKTPMHLLESAGVVTTIKPTRNEMKQLVGASWGEEVRDPDHLLPSGDYILIAHVSVGDDSKRAEKYGFSSAYEYLKKYIWAKLIVVGDYHYPFMIFDHGRVIVNAGCLVRMRVPDDLTRTPTVYTYDTEKDIRRAIEEFPLEYKRAEEVFDTTETEEVKENAALQELLAKLRAEQVITVEFNANLNKALQDSNTTTDVKKYIGEKLERLHL